VWWLQGSQGRTASHCVLQNHIKTAYGNCPLFLVLGSAKRALRLRYLFDLLWNLHSHVTNLLLPASWSNPFWTSPQSKFQLFEDGYLDFNLRLRHQLNRAMQVRQPLRSVASRVSLLTFSAYSQPSWCALRATFFDFEATIAFWLSFYDLLRLQQPPGLTVVHSRNKWW
jgi:hypothetical protein